MQTCVIQSSWVKVLEFNLINGRIYYILFMCIEIFEEGTGGTFAKVPPVPDFLILTYFISFIRYTSSSAFSAKSKAPSLSKNSRPRKPQSTEMQGIPEFFAV